MRLIVAWRSLAASAVILGSGSLALGVTTILFASDPNCVAVGEGKRVTRRDRDGNPVFSFPVVRPLTRCRQPQCAPFGTGDLCNPTIQVSQAGNTVFVRVFCKCTSDPGEPSGCRTVFESERPVPTPANTPAQWTAHCEGTCPNAADKCRLTLEPIQTSDTPGLDPVSCVCFPP